MHYKQLQWISVFMFIFHDMIILKQKSMYKKYRGDPLPGWIDLCHLEHRRRKVDVGWIKRARAGQTIRSKLGWTGSRGLEG
jgi:hypothetical protein